MTLTKSQVLGTNPNRVLDLLDDWLRTVDTLEQQAETYKRYTQRPGGSSWEGKTAEATQTRANQDYRIVANLCTCVERATAQIRNTVTSTLMPPLSNAQQIIANAEASPGVTVHEDLSITYTAAAGTSQQAADANRKVVAEAAAELKESADKWWSAENQVAQQIRDAQSAVGNAANFGSTTLQPARARIQTVDHHTFKQDPQPPPGPPGNPFAGWTDEQMAQVAAEIAHGHGSSKHFPGTSPAEVARSIYDMMKDPHTRVATSIESGGMALLRPDGTIVFVNPRDGDYGTVFKPQPRPNDSWRTPLEYFEQHTKAFEPLPPPSAGRFPPVTPGEMAPPASPPGVEGVPTAGPRPEPPPAGRGGITGSEGGTSSPGGPRTGGSGPGAGGGGGIRRPYPLSGMPPL